MKPKYIRVCSDLHLEQFSGKKISALVDQFVPADERDAESVLALAGDISSKQEQLVEFIKELEPRFLKIYFVAGNHEFYGYEMNLWAETTNVLLGNSSQRKIETSLLETSYEELEGVRFIFCTLWADGGFSLAERHLVENSLRDFYVIRIDDRKFTVNDMVGLHNQQQQKIKEYAELPFDGTTVVITHHLPSHDLCHPRFGPDLNGGFASECDELLMTGKIDMWIHGHTHDSYDRTVWRTRVVCNPAGYRGEKGSPYNQFGPKFIELETLNG